MSRKVRICTISMNSLIHGTTSSKEDRFKEAEAKMKRGSLDRPDLFLLPEHFLVNDAPGIYKDPASFDEKGGETYQRLGRAARSYNAYVAASLLTCNDEVRHNAVVIFDRSGEPVFEYAKTHPTGGEIDQGVVPGKREPDTFDADFGRVGVALCYDLNFQHLFRHYHDRGVELLLFSTYFPGGMLLRSWCYLYNFFAVSSHAQGYESAFINNLGVEETRADMFSQALTHEFELDCAVVPYWNSREQIWAAKEKYGADLVLDIHRAEGDVVLKYVGQATTAKDILTEFGIQTKAEAYNNEHLL